MLKLEDLKPNASVRGVLPDSLVTVVNVQWFGSDAVGLISRTPTGKLDDRILYRHDEPRLEAVEQGRPWSFDGDGAGEPARPRPPRAWPGGAWYAKLSPEPP